MKNYNSSIGTVGSYFEAASRSAQEPIHESFVVYTVHVAYVSLKRPLRTWRLQTTGVQKDCKVIWRSTFGESGFW